MSFEEKLSKNEAMVENKTTAIDHALKEIKELFKALINVYPKEKVALAEFLFKHRAATMQKDIETIVRTDQKRSYEAKAFLKHIDKNIQSTEALTEHSRAFIAFVTKHRPGSPGANEAIAEWSEANPTPIFTPIFPSDIGESSAADLIPFVDFLSELPEMIKLDRFITESKKALR